jgi:phospholipid/cholesterol/gamma-HCH transport system ATP-binding protein
MPQECQPTQQTANTGGETAESSLSDAVTPPFKPAAMTDAGSPGSAGHPSDRNPAILRLEQVDLRFGEQEVLRNLSLEIQRGQTTVIIGESGCGKTVLLKLLVGLIPPSRGRVWLDGVDLHQLREEELVRQRLRFGFVFQGAALFDSMDVYDNVAFPLRQHTDLDESAIYHRVVQQLAEIGLSEEVLRKYPAELSGGMRKRVGLARALILQPEIVLYDEPTTGLDPIMGDVINELIRLTHERRQVTSVVVTHDMRTVRKVAHRVLMLYPLRKLQANESQILFDGTVEQLDQATDPRVRQFVAGEAGDWLHRQE